MEYQAGHEKLYGYSTYKMTETTTIENLLAAQIAILAILAALQFIMILVLIFVTWQLKVGNNIRERYYDTLKHHLIISDK